jgi:hypothetical protein
MGLICNQLEGKLNDEVINEDIDKTSNSLANSSKRRRKSKQFSLNPQHFLHNLFRWYFKSTSSLHDDTYTTPSSCNKNDFGFTTILRNNNDAEHDLVYREHKKAQTQTLNQRNVSSSSSSSSSIASKVENFPRSRRRRSSSPSSNSTTSSSSSSNLSLTNSHYYIRQSICLYAASSVILALCYLVTPSTAATDSASHPV